MPKILAFMGRCLPYSSKDNTPYDRVVRKLDSPHYRRYNYKHDLRRICKRFHNYHLGNTEHQEENAYS